MIVGVLGDGQLGQMLAQAGKNLDLQFKFFSTSDAAPVQGLGEIYKGNLTSKDDVLAFAHDVSVITYETENISPQAIEWLLLSGKKVCPGLKSLTTSQDRLFEKQTFDQLGIPTNRFIDVQSIEDVKVAFKTLNSALVVKSRRFGYDGKNQVRVKSASDISKANFPESMFPAIAEEFVSFDFEVSQICTRSMKGEIEFYPIVKNIHHDGILHWSHTLEQNLSETLEAKSHNYIRLLADHFDHIGTLTIEFFVKGKDLIANEIAPRVHNSGHWSIEACETSQFTNHLLAITGKKLGSAKATSPFVMYNLIGVDKPPKSLPPHVHLHWYYKVVKPGRKVGHLTTLVSSMNNLQESKKLLADLSLSK